ncbi:MAG: hypothetical protein AVDCRST_MAG04-3889, partial [uncultured Acetobacteraceae bacterium]
AAFLASRAHRRRVALRRLRRPDRATGLPATADGGGERRGAAGGAALLRRAGRVGRGPAGRRGDGAGHGAARGPARRRRLHPARRVDGRPRHRVGRPRPLPQLPDRHGRRRHTRRL